MVSIKVTEVAPFSRSGPLISGDISPVPWVMRFPCRLDGIVAHLNPQEAAADRDVILDVLKNGVSIFTNPALRPRILVGEYDVDWSASFNAMVVDFVRLDAVQPVVVQSGTASAPGHGLGIGIEYSRTSA